ncbi:MAG: glycosyltransferase family 4 protein [Chloroflexaceae bacterium]|jgi:glycosyltransferase involved in cell wall biosynthesis|nr:glycosyltransferase family 4 protein [Chloroflexaceae bacterium]
MHVAINAHLLAHTANFRRAGVSHYVEALLHHLGQIDTHNRYTVYTTKGVDAAALGLPANFVVRPSRFPTINPRVRIPWEQLIAPISLAREGADVYHGVLNVMPLCAGIPSVVTIHDLSAMLFPQTFRRINRMYTRWAINVSAKRAAHILTVSEYARQEIITHLNVPAERVTVTYDACDERFRPSSPAELAAFRQRNGLPERFFFYLGTLEPRKNIPRLLDAYAKIAHEVDAPLLIGGGKGWLYEPILAQAERLQLGDKLKFVGYIPQEDQHLWYGAATAFVFPSLYEGFGMPPLEAMACGTPVIVSNASSLPEVTGDAGLQVDPYDVDGWADAMRRVLTDRTLHADLAARGPRQAAKFSWVETAQRTLEVYQRVVRR